MNKKVFRQDDGPIIVGAYSVEEIKAFNAAHDRKYGWSVYFSSLYSNLQRHPETYTGPIANLWDQPTPPTP